MSFPLLKVGRLLLPLVVWVKPNFLAYLLGRYLLFLLVEEVGFRRQIILLLKVEG